MDVEKGTRQLRGLIEKLERNNRTLRSHPTIVGIATAAEAEGFLGACDRGLLLARQTEIDSVSAANRGSMSKVVPLNSPELWDLVFTSVTSRG